MMSKLESQFQRQWARSRKGALLVEALVAATILMVAVSLLSGAHHGLSKLWLETRRHQLATDELSNQMERVLALSEQQQTQSLESLQVTPEIAEILPGAALEAVWIDDSLGRRLVLKLNWQRRGAAQPLQLVGWVSGQSASAQPPQEVQP